MTRESVTTRSIKIISVRVMIVLVVSAGSGGWIAEAHELGGHSGQSNEPGWIFQLGVGVAVLPKYPGSDELEVQPLPLIDARYADIFYMSTLQGIGWNVLRNENLSVGPFIRYEFGRDDEGDLSPLEDLDGGAIAGMLASYAIGSIDIDGDIATAVSGDIDGERATLRVGWRGTPTAVLGYGVGAYITWASDDWNDALFSLSPAQAQRVRLRSYTAGGGFSRAGLSGHLVRSFNEHWSVSAVAEMSRVLGDAADSPIVEEIGNEMQVFVGVLLGYRF